MNKSNSKHKKSILVLPRWYPNKIDVQLGIFIQRQVILMEDHFRVFVVYAQALDDLDTSYKEVIRETKSRKEHIVYFKNAKGPFRKLINLIRYNKAQRRALSQLKEKIDLCHIHVPYRSALPALKLKLLKGVPFLVTEHWSGHLNGLFEKKNALDKFIYKKILKRAAKISTVSPALKEAFKQNTGFDSIVIPNYIERAHEPEKVNYESINILSVSDFDDRTKNIKGLLTAFRNVLAFYPKLKLTLIGGGPDETEINALIDTLDFPKGSLNLTGRQDHNFVLRAMQMCDFYVCNSRFETFGMTIAEALYCGKPVISTKCGGPEIFLNDSNSILIEPANPGELNWEPLSDAISAMVKRLEVFDSEKISSAIEKQFGKEAILSYWLDFYTL